MVEVLAGDGVSALTRAAPGAYDLVFLDPPYDSGVLATALAAAVRPLVAGGFVYTEAPAPLAELPAGLVACKQARAGQVHYQLLRREPAA